MPDRWPEWLRFFVFTSVAVLVWNFRSKAVQDVVLFGAFAFALWRNPRGFRMWLRPAGVVFLVAGLLFLLLLPLNAAPAATWRQMVKYADVALAALAIPALFPDRKRVETALFYSAWGIAVVLGYDLLRLVASLKGQVLTRAHELEPFAFQHSNLSAMMAGAAWFVLGYFAWVYRRSRPRCAACMAGMVVLLGFLVVIGSRGPQIAFAGAGVAGALLVLPGWKRKALALFLLMLCVGALVTNIEWINPRFADAENLRGFVDRDKVWAHTLHLVSEKPWLGHGFGKTVFNAVYDGSNPPDSPHDFQHAHQYWLYVAFSFGAVGLLVHLVGWGLLTRDLFRRVGWGGASTLLPALILTLALHLHIYGLGDWPAQVVGIMMIWLVPVALVVSGMPEVGCRRSEVGGQGSGGGTSAVDVDSATVVIPLYNKSGTIERAVRSVLAQDAGVPQVVVVDDGSTDGSAERVEALRVSSVRVVRQANAGAAAARNRGITEADTPLVAFLDADDEWKPGFLGTVLALRNRCPQARMWATAYEEVAPGGETRGLAFHAVPTDPGGGVIEDFFESVCRFPPVCSSNVLVDAGVLEEVGGFPEGEALAEDWDLWARIALRYPVAFSPLVQAVYHRESGDRAMLRYHFDGRRTALTVTLERAIQEKACATAPMRSVRRLLVKHRLEIAKDVLQSGDPRRARDIIRDAGRWRALRLRRFRWWWKTCGRRQST